ncbi:hypothetical protein ES332_D06G147700v1 [Gossypium tomentosum]|uniref:Uncharacterized protein n=1 Tax=Gossypium tomentosum TaxID=34277 RepID=A0A5D2KL65_GOSTO|nr:hypothetical protein ES332_D06G147700v1 [Gossypium tomentosum]
MNIIFRTLCRYETLSELIKLRNICFFVQISFILSISCEKWDDGMLCFYDLDCKFGYLRVRWKYKLSFLYDTFLN